MEVISSRVVPSKAPFRFAPCEKRADIGGGGLHGQICGSQSN